MKRGKKGTNKEGKEIRTDKEKKRRKHKGREKEKEGEYFFSISKSGREYTAVLFLSQGLSKST
jgi:hypothetical protein